MVNIGDRDIWYFAYGSNLNVAQMKKRIGEWKAERKAALKNYRLTFNGYSAKWDNKGVADIVESEGNSVKGAIYRISEEQLAILDICEGYKGIEGRNIYNRNVPERPMYVISGGEEVGVVTYYVADAARQSKFNKPSDKYLETIIEGLRHHGWGEDVVREVKEIAKSRGERI